jgi:hypothetical protein
LKKNSSRDVKCRTTPQAEKTLSVVFCPKHEFLHTWRHTNSNINAIMPDQEFSIENMGKTAIYLEKEKIWQAKTKGALILNEVND